MMKHTIAWLTVLLLTLTPTCWARAYPNDDGAANLQSTTEKTTTAIPRKGNTTVSPAPPVNASTMVAKTIENKITSVTAAHHETTTSKISTSHDQFPTANLHYSTTHTTTAMPHVDAPSSVVSPRQFDVLSFMGGSMFTVALAFVGVVSWKLYKLHVERSYRTI